MGIVSQPFLGNSFPGTKIVFLETDHHSSKVDGPWIGMDKNHSNAWFLSTPKSQCPMKKKKTSWSVLLYQITPIFCCWKITNFFIPGSSSHRPSRPSPGSARQDVATGSVPGPLQLPGPGASRSAKLRARLLWKLPIKTVEKSGFHGDWMGIFCWDIPSGYD